MTHYELLQACRTVRDNLGRKGTISVDAAISEDHSEIFGNYRDGYRLSWTIAFHDSKGGAGAHIQVSLMESQKVAFDHWTEAMRERFGERPVIEPVELAEVLDAHKVEAA